MSTNVSRLTLFAIISGIESDLRSIIESWILPHESFETILDHDLLQKLIARFEKDRDESYKTEHSKSLLYYLDFGDGFSLINGHLGKYDKVLAGKVKAATTLLQKLVPIRNRVAHSRPLNADDLSNTIDICDELLKDTIWKGLSEVIEKLRDDPGYVLSLKIPTYYSEADIIQNNLPIPDFDETGFLGREKIITQLKKQCLGSFPVITLQGEGGIGKTAVALRVAYDLLDDPKCPFEAIVWTSCKTMALTGHEIKRIHGAISTSTGLIISIAQELAGQTPDDPIEEIIDYLSVFKVFLIIDNLETVLDERVKQFISKIPEGSKVLITSRIGLGAYEYPITIPKMDDSECVRLMRTLCKIRQIKLLEGLPNATLQKYSNKLNGNPGFIKWFISAIHAGARPEEVLMNQENFLDFCMSNVYTHLREESKALLDVMQCVPGLHDQGELAYLSEMEATKIQMGIQQLWLCNMVTMENFNKNSYNQTKYDLSSMCRSYLSKHHPVGGKKYKEITSKRGQLVAAHEQIRADHLDNPYSPSSIKIRNAGDIVVAKYLIDALRHLRARNPIESEKAMQSAKKLAPDFFEIYRVEGYIQVKLRNYSAAREAYEIAIELEPNSPQLRKWFGGFLLRYSGEPELAEIQLLESVRLDPKSFENKLDLACSLMYQKKFSQSGEILSSLEDTVAVNNEWQNRKLCDSLVQQCSRNADYQLSKHEFSLAIENLENLRKLVCEKMVDFVDDHVRESVNKAIGAGISCNRYGVDANQREFGSQFVEWVKNFSGLSNSIPYESERLDQEVIVGTAETGTIKRTRGTFGFIQGDNGEEYFFHFKHVSPFLENLEGTTGKRVSFSIGKNNTGPCATNVTFL